MVSVGPFFFPNAPLAQLCPKKTPKISSSETMREKVVREKIVS